MIIVLSPTAPESDIAAILDRVETILHGVDGLNVQPILSITAQRRLIALPGLPDAGTPDPSQFESIPGVDRVVSSTRPFLLADREAFHGPTEIDLGRGVVIGGDRIVVAAGPCAVENREQLLESARAVRESGARVLRGGAFKPRTSPYAFQGLGEEGLKLLAEARSITGQPVVTEVMTPSEVETVASYADVLQIGARNMQNYDLLREVGRTLHPVVLKRAPAGILEELVLAAEYILAAGNPNVILCERGIRTFETATRNTLDLSAVPVLKEWTHLPVMVDPSHGTGTRFLVAPMALAAIAAGADGLLIEVHPHPERALSDGPQALTPVQFSDLMRQAAAVAAAVGRTV